MELARASGKVEHPWGGFLLLVVLGASRMASFLDCFFFLGDPKKNTKDLTSLPTHRVRKLYQQAISNGIPVIGPKGSKNNLVFLWGGRSYLNPTSFSLSKRSFRDKQTHFLCKKILDLFHPHQKRCQKVGNPLYLTLTGWGDVAPFLTAT